MVDANSLSTTLFVFTLILIVTSHGEAALRFKLRGVSYSNGDTVLLEDIGEGENALFCTTTETDCCGVDVNGTVVPGETRGNFTYPVSGRVPTRGDVGDDGLFIERGYQNISLQRLSNATSAPPTGKYECHIPYSSSSYYYYYYYYGYSKIFINIVHLGVYLYKSGTTYPNNSIISITGIGVGSNALQCRTDSTQCCRTEDDPNGTATGQWFYPNGSEVSERGNFYKTNQVSSVNLNRWSETTYPAGHFQCVIPNDNGDNETLSVYLFSIKILKGPQSGNTAGEQYFLTCKVDGTQEVPSFSWSARGRYRIDTRMVSDVMSNGSTHTSILKFDPLISSHQRSYTCTVRVGNVTEMESIQVYVRTPVITAMVSGDTPIVGESYSLTCTVNGTDGLNATIITYNWFYTQYYYGYRRISGETQSKLSFSPLSQFDDGRYKCEVTIRSPFISRNIERSSESFRLSIPAPNIATVTVSGGTPTAGKSYSLACTFPGADGLNPKTYQWFKDNAEISGQTQSTLSFSPLSLSDAGQYRCEVNINSDLLKRKATAVSNTHDLIVTIPFAVTITASPDGTTFTGTPFTLICSIELSEAVDKPVTVNTMWSGPSGTQFATNTSKITRITIILASKLSIDELRDSTEYTCMANVTSTSQFIISSGTVTDYKTITDVMQMFQVNLMRTDDCLTWNTEKATEIQTSIHNQMLWAIRKRCHCKLPNEVIILPGTFSCQQSLNQTTYRSSIIATYNYNATTLVGYIQDWVISDPTLTIQWYTVKLDQKCPLSISSLEDPECRAAARKISEYI